MGKYEEIFQKSIEDPEGFWGEAAEAIDWYKKWDKVLDDSNKPFYRWVTGGELNTCYNALDRHVENGRADQVALIYDSPVTNTIQKFTYAELLDMVAQFAGGLRDIGVVKGYSYHLHADDPPGSSRHAGMCPSGRGPFGGLRGVCPP